MRIKRLFPAFVVLTQTALASQVALTVLDTEGRPVPQAEAAINFLLSRPQVHFVGVTDNRGYLKAEGQSLLGYQIDVKKPGYYSAQWDISPAVARLERTVVLPAKKNPIPLFARRMGYWSDTEADLVRENEWIGYDFEVGEWVAPYGRGQTTDIRFRYRREFRGYRYTPTELENEIRISKEIAARDRVEWAEEKFKAQHGRWSGEMEVSFPGEKEGILEVIEQFLPYSQLKMPHEAPVEGYGSGRGYALNNFSPSGYREDVGFFLRTRVKLDERGEIVSANYAKVVGDFNFRPQGRLFFTYYFNPTPNDRNLELDPERNLFRAPSPGAAIRDP